MEHVVFPELATVQLVTGGATPAPLRLAGVVFSVRLSARAKSDYALQPFVSDSDGVVHIRGEVCRWLVEAEHESGLMDYAGVESCAPGVEIRALTGGETADVAAYRRTAWRTLLRGEDRLFRTIEDLVATYERAANGRLLGGRPLTPRWDGSDPNPVYMYAVDRVAPT